MQKWVGVKCRTGWHECYMLLLGLVCKILPALWLTLVCLFCRVALPPALLLCFLSLSQSATAMATPASATLTWLCTWRRGTPAGECVMSASTTPWDATASSASPSTSCTPRETCGTPTSASVSAAPLRRVGMALASLSKGFVLEVLSEPAWVLFSPWKSGNVPGACVSKPRDV